jgi:hypothetical protein
MAGGGEQRGGADRSAAELPRALMVQEIAAVICREDPEHPVRVAIDGITASGKSERRRWGSACRWRVSDGVWAAVGSAALYGNSKASRRTGSPPSSNAPAYADTHERLNGAFEQVVSEFEITRVDEWPAVARRACPAGREIRDIHLHVRER